MKTSRLPTPREKYDQREEAEFRRAVQESFGDNEFDSIRIAGGLLYNDGGALKFRSANNTVTTVGPL